MKILNITAQKPHSTGSGTYLTEIVRAFDRMGHKQAVVAGIYENDSVSFPSGVDFYPVYFNTAKLPLPIVGMSDIMPYGSTKYRDLDDEKLTRFESSFISVISEAVSALNPDIIFCHHLFLLTALVRKHFPDRKVYGMSHGTDLRQMINCPKLAEFVRPEIRKLDKVMVLHSAQLDTICEIFGFNEEDERLKIIGSGYNSELFNSEGRSALSGRIPRIIYAGKISRPKGVAELLKASELLAADADTPDYELVLAGGCQDDGIYQVLESAPANVKYIGQLPQAELAQLFKTGDVFVLPSYFEGLPLVIIEAMASGMLPVCTDLPGISEWLNVNIPNSNILFIPMPQMKTIDTPAESDVPIFVHNIYLYLKKALLQVLQGFQPASTASLTWDCVATKIIT